ncbi:MAG: hypothetical protein GTO02_21655, partial [Candidatus Dadabacteria bacterium]|nr:hypothetical protein [Candidatus Dadabacteria bacterium]
MAVEGKQTNPSYGNVPFLNGSMFEENELDRKVADIPDSFFKPIIGPEGLFYKYNFTVEESTPLDIEVAVDPEMLGKVFEELVTSRHETGAYYTPRTIVSFMCRESIKGFLGGYESLVDEGNVNNVNVSDAKELLKKLKKIKVCDPACGSGAYLLGMLNELYRLNIL